MNKRQVIQVRYRNSNGMLSRPHKIQKITMPDGKVEYHTMNMNSKRWSYIDEKNEERRGINPSIIEIVSVKVIGQGKMKPRPNYKTNDWKQYTKLEKSVTHKGKKWNTRKVEQIRVKFKKIDGGLYRPTSLYKRIYKFIDEEQNEIIIKIIYSKKLNSCKEFKIEDFLIEGEDYEAGPTPNHKGKVGENNCKSIDKVYKYLIKTGHKFTKYSEDDENSLSNHQQAKILLESGKLDIKTVHEYFHTTNLEKKENREKQRRLKEEKKNKNGFKQSVHGRDGIFSLQYRKDDELHQKNFPSKGLLNNQEYKKIVKGADEIIKTSYKAKRGTVDKNRKKQWLLQQTPEWKEKTKIRRKKHLEKELETQKIYVKEAS